MKSYYLYLIFVGIALLCSCQRQAKPSTDFFRDFNLGGIVEQMNASEFRPTVGGSGTSTSIGESTKYRRDFGLEYRIEDQFGKRFDEEKFLGELKDEVAKIIKKTGVHEEGFGSSRDSFYFNYSKDKNNGWIEIIAARLDGNKYKVWCMIRENAQSENED